MSRYAAGSRALGICDRCGFTYELNLLKEETVNFSRTNRLVCPECFDEDHPQLHLSRYTFEDPQALRNPRVDTGRVPGNSLGGYDPVNGTVVVTTVGSVFIL